MYCSNCGTEMEQGVKYCHQCGHHLHKSASKFSGLMKFLLLTVLVIGISISSYYIWQSSFADQRGNPVAENNEEAVETAAADKEKMKMKEEAVPVKKEQTAPPPEDVSEMIRRSQPKVFTILTSYGQGSGFLIDQHGHVLTNAHVVEGDVAPIVRTMNGAEYEGQLIGYSNSTDVALIHVPALKGIEPLQLEEQASAEIGEEVIALGTPMGYENTATLGNISGTDRTFVIPPFEFKGIYQISAPIAPGNSGGPLISQETGKVIAINSARDVTEATIGFSIPIYQVSSFIHDWISSPMTADEMYALFYYNDDLFYFQDYLDDFGYFEEDGDFIDDYNVYYEIPYDADYWDDEWYWEDWGWDTEYYEEDSGSYENDSYFYDSYENEAYEYEEYKYEYNYDYESGWDEMESWDDEQDIEYEADEMQEPDDDSYAEDYDDWETEEIYEEEFYSEEELEIEDSSIDEEIENEETEIDDME